MRGDGRKYHFLLMLLKVMLEVMERLGKGPPRTANVSWHSIRRTRGKVCVCIKRRALGV